MKNVLTVPAGTTLQDATIPGSQTVKSITVDNPSGSWLYVVNSQSNIPPYTMGWAENFDYNATSVTIQSKIGPYGQYSAATGDPFIVTLDTEPVIPSTGNSYVTRQYQAEYVPSPAGFSLTVNFGALPSQTTTWLGGSTTKRLRLFSAVILPSTDIQTHIFFGLSTPTTLGNQFSPPSNPLHFWYGMVGPNNQVNSVFFNPTIDLPVGAEITLTASMLRGVGGDSDVITFQALYQIV